ncbi:MAG: hypothetical protein DRO67_03750 [Candidatus Asgardarchaeum californiense]|nr:MAG: hypothetical protein DRO67_03750 [Candidatus Asgardarchaeum californiense]
MGSSLTCTIKNVTKFIPIHIALLIIILQTISYSVIADNPLYIRVGGPYHGEVNETINFKLDIQGGVLPYNILWNFGDGNTSTKQFPSHVYKKTGRYTVSATVVDGEGTSITKYTSAYVYDPLIAIIGSPYSCYVGELIEITGNATGGVQPYTYYWDLDNDQKFNDAQDRTISKIWETPGTYTIGLQVKDYFGNTNISITQIIVRIENSKPDKPGKPSGPTSGKVGVEYEYVFVTTDPDNDKIFYKVDWGNGETSEWIGPFASGESITTSHVWSIKGTYPIKVLAKDINGAESSWSDSLNVSMSKNKAVLKTVLHNLIERFFQYFKIKIKFFNLI